MATLAVLQSNVAAMLGLDNSASPGDQGLITNWLNEGYTDVLLRTHCKVGTTTLNLTAGTGDYTLAASILTTLDLYLTSGGTNYRFERSTPQEILSYRLNAATSIPRCYAVAGANLLMLYPVPLSADTLTIYQVAAPTALSAGTDVPSDVPAEQHKLIEWYACWRGADYDDDSTSNQGDRYKTMYLDGIKEFRRLIQRKGGSRLAPARLRGRRRTGLPSDPSRTAVW